MTKAKRKTAASTRSEDQKARAARGRLMRDLREQPVTTRLTAAELAAVDAVGARLGVGRAQAARALILAGLRSEVTWSAGVRSVDPLPPAGGEGGEE